MNKTIIFIINNIGDSHCHHRVMEYINAGYEVKVFGFERPNSTFQENLPYTIQNIGYISSGKYLNRTRIYYKGLRQAIENQPQNAIYYIFGLDMACYFKLFCPHRKYIYEEADLVYTYLPSAITKVLKRIDQVIIRNAVQTVFTSEGFVRYHYGNSCPKNVIVVPNKLSKEILNYPVLPKKESMKGLRFAFVGYARFDSLYHFINTLLAHFPQHEFHFYGTTEPRMKEFENQYKNVFYHGRFTNPVDLPQIYQNIDILVCTYDYRYANVRYAEPNKLYESIYFRTPIIVSKGTFLNERVEKMGIGYAVDPFDENDIVNVINQLSADSIQEKINNITAIKQYEAIA